MTAGIPAGMTAGIPAADAKQQAERIKELKEKAKNFAMKPVTGCKGGINALLKKPAGNQQQRSTFQDWKLEIFSQKSYIRKKDAQGNYRHM
eukprot:159850-Karenia_brevis.AAC.1